MKEIDLSKLPLTELVKLQKALPALINEAKKTEKAALRQKIETLATESGFELAEVFGVQPKAKKKSRQIGFVKAKYHNPNNVEETWTGRGRKPKWAAAHLKAGGELQDLLINPEIID